MVPLVVTIAVPDSEQKRTVAYVESPVFVGRGPLNELQLDEPWVARTEGVLEFSDEGITYARQSARNRVTVDGRELTSGSAVVKTELVLGTITLAFTRRAARPDELWKPSLEAQEHGVRSQPAETVALAAVSIETLRAAHRGEPPPSTPPPSTPPPAARAQPAESRTSSAPPAHGHTVLGTGSAVGISRIERLGTPGESSVRISRSEPPMSELPRGAFQSLRPPPAGGDLDLLYGSYRASWSALGAELVRRLEAAPVDVRPWLAAELQRTYPQITREPEFRELLKRLDLKARTPDDPDIEAWLKRIEKVLPPGVKLQNGFSTERLLQILEGYTGAFVDLNAAQEEVRRRSLGKLPRESLLRQSDDPALILAYLLNPSASWSSRMAELSSVIKYMVRHDWALMQATMEGARELLEALAPEAIAKQEEVDLPVRERSQGRGFWQRASSNSEAVAARLWFRFVEEYQSLVQGDRYQRTFLGARFSKRYTKAMGAGEKDNDAKKVR